MVSHVLYTNTKNNNKWDINLKYTNIYDKIK